MIYVKPIHNVGMMLMELQQNNVMCDVELRSTGNISVMIHSVVLAAHSEVLTTAIKQLSPCVIHVESTEDSKPYILEGLTKLMYGLQLSIHSDDIKEYCEIAFSLGLKRITNDLIQSSPSKIKMCDAIPIIIEEHKNNFNNADKSVSITDSSYITSESDHFESGLNYKIKTKDPLKYDNIWTDLEHETNSDKIFMMTTMDNIEDSVSDDHRTNLVENRNDLIVDDCQSRLTKNVDCYIEITLDEYIENNNQLDINFNKKKNHNIQKVNKKQKLLHSNEVEINKHESKSVINLTGVLHCGDCNISFRKCSNLVKHVISLKHYTEVCPICSFKSTDSSEQESHFLVHDSTLPFLCPGCDLRFRTRAHLAMHAPKHSSSKPFSCIKCARSFKWRHALQAHILTHQTMRNLLCDICGFSTNYITNFKAHLLQHSGKAFVCPHSGCSFKAFRKDNLKGHIATHSKLRPHQCDVCGKDFSVARNLTRHMRIHSTTRIQCSAVSKTLCQFVATRADKMRCHLHKKHNIKFDAMAKFEEVVIHEKKEKKRNCSKKVELINSVQFLNDKQSTSYNNNNKYNKQSSIVSKVAIPRLLKGSKELKINQLIPSTVTLAQPSAYYVVTNPNNSNNVAKLKKISTIESSTENINNGISYLVTDKYVDNGVTNKSLIISPSSSSSLSICSASQSVSSSTLKCIVTESVSTPVSTTSFISNVPSSLLFDSSVPSNSDIPSSQSFDFTVPSTSSLNYVFSSSSLFDSCVPSPSSFDSSVPSTSSFNITLQPIPFTTQSNFTKSSFESELNSADYFNSINVLSLEEPSDDGNQLFEVADESADILSPSSISTICILNPLVNNIEISASTIGIGNKTSTEDNSGS